MMRYFVAVERICERKLNEEKRNEKLNKIVATAKRNSTYNFSAKLVGVNEICMGNQYKYIAVIVVGKTEYKSPGVVRDYFDKVIKNMAKTANHLSWTLIGEIDAGEVKKILTHKPEVEKKATEEKKVASKINLDLPPLTSDVYAKYFGRLYSREPQIRLIYDSAAMAIRTGFKERHHILLRGLAATAKTETFEAFKNWWGDEFVWHVDATTVTKAGLERELIRRSNEGLLPPFILIEEIEKVTSPDNINCLLQVMDTRGRIQRTNARTGDVYAECKVIVWATCNDSEYLRTFADGAIWSRFSLRPICKRPDEELMRKILHRTINEINGKPEWVEVVIRFMWDRLRNMKDFKNDYNDPRLGRALLAGGDRLFDNGSSGFLADFVACCEGKETGE